MTTVSGIVRDTEQNAIAGASVSVVYRKPLVGFDGGAAVQNVRQFTTAGDGTLTMADLVPGHYDITIAIVANDDTTLTVLRKGTMTVLDQANQTLQNALDASFEPITPSDVQRAEAAAAAAEADRIRAETAATTAEGFLSQAELAAIAAGAPLVRTLTDPVPANGTIELLFVDSRNLIVYEVVTGAWVNRGYLIGPYYSTIATMTADDVAFPNGTQIQVGRWFYTTNSALTQGFLENAGSTKIIPLVGDSGRASIMAFGCTLNGTTDDTAAFQLAFDSGLPLASGKGTLLITDTILLDPDADFLGVRSVANYEASPLQIHFAPETKRDVFAWRTPPTGINYALAGLRLVGFTIRGFAPNGESADANQGAAACLNIKGAYGAIIDFKAFAGVDCWIKMQQWIDSDVKGGVQGYRTYGVEFFSDGVNASDVTTSTKIEAYISQGPCAYYAANRAVTDVRAGGVVESCDHACDMATGNTFIYDGYQENTPRSNAGAAWIVGKTGTAGAESTSIQVNLRVGQGWTGGTPTATTLMDLGKVRYAELSGFAELHAHLLATTADTQQVVLSNLDTDNITALSAVDGIANYSKLTGVAFHPKNMLLVPGASEFIDFPAWVRSVDLIARPRTEVANGKIFKDSTRNNKIFARDEFGNFTAPIGALRVTGTSGWTVQGGRLTPGELVQNTATTLGEPALWVSTRYTKDTGNDYTGCSTTSGSPIITNPTVGTFFLCEIGDYVTVSDGFGDAVLQRRVIARSADLTSITVDSNATSTVSGTVAVSTEAHKLLPVAQQGHRETGADPVGVLTPNFVLEQILRTDTDDVYIAVGTTSSDWKQITA